MVREEIPQDRRIEEAVDLIIQLATGNLKARGTFMRSGDPLDAMIGGLNMLAEELELSVASRDRAEEALRRNEELFRTLIETQGEGAAIIDPEEYVVFVNPAAEHIFGVPPGSLVGRNLHEFLEPDQIAIIREETKKQQRGEKSTYEITIMRPTGERRCLWLTATPRFDDEKQFVGSFGVFRDITERKQAEEERRKLEIQLRQTQRLESLGTLAGGIAHDFNNILGTMLGYTELLRAKYSDASKEWDYLDRIYRAGERAADLIRQILTFSRVREQQLIPTDIAPLIEESLKMMRATLPSDIEIRQRVQADCPSILADATQIQQVLVNMCTNAGYAMREQGGILDVIVEAVAREAYPDALAHMPEQRYVLLSVSDTGCGILPEIQEHIFEPFFTTKAVDEGTGLGLSVVYGIVQDHHGTIAVQSELGKGTTFRIFFPATTRSGTSAIPKTESVKHGKGSILIADDEPGLTELYEIALTKLGYRVTIRHTGTEALDVFRANPSLFDLVFTDQTMPKMTGMQLSQELVRIRDDIPIILTTGHNDVLSEEQARALGIRQFLRKPVKIYTLIQVIQNILENP